MTRQCEKSSHLISTITIPKKATLPCSSPCKHFIVLYFRSSGISLKTLMQLIAAFNGEKKPCLFQWSAHSIFSSLLSNFWFNRVDPQGKLPSTFLIVGYHVRQIPIDPIGFVLSFKLKLWSKVSKSTVLSKNAYLIFHMDINQECASHLLERITAVYCKLL